MVIENKTNNIITSDLSNVIMVTLEYEGNHITFPINPDTLKEVIDSSATTENIEGIGEVSVPQIPSLSTIAFSSFFWGDIDKTNPKDYVKWIKTWQASRKPARFTVSNIDWDINVTCESFSHWVNAGEENDIYFDIVLKEYREYGAKPVTIVNGQYVFMGGNVINLSNNEMKKAFDFDVEPVFFKTTKKRTKINKNIAITSVILGVDESPLSIAKKYSDGSVKDWEVFFNCNKYPIAEGVSKGIEGADLVVDMSKIIGNSTNLSYEAINNMRNLTRLF